ncbi:2325_t:CDS:2, partial [Funneliformis caledonium]
MSNEIKIHKYFDQDPANWSILGFLNECELEPFEMKIDSYVKWLKKIVDCEQDIKKKSAQALLDNYHKASSLPSHETGVGAPVTSLELSDAKGSLPIQHRTHWAQDQKPDRKKAREWEQKRSRGKTYIHQIGNGNVVGFNSNINSGTFTGLSKRESSDDFIRQPKRKKLSLSKDKKSNVSVKKAKTTGRNMDDDIDYPFISDNRAINLAESSDFSKDNSSSSSSIRGSVSFDNPFDNQSQDLNNSTIPGSETESINVFNSISSEAKDHEIGQQVLGTGNNVSIDNIDNRRLTEKHRRDTNNEEEEMPNIEGVTSPLKKIKTADRAENMD